MRFTSVAIAALAGCAQAEWLWVEPITITGNSKETPSAAVQAYVSRVSEYFVTVTTGSDYQQAKSELDSYLATRTGVPAIVTRTGLAAVTTYTSKPGWFDDAPEAAKKFIEKQRDETRKLAQQLQNDVNGGSRPVALSLYANGALVAVVAGLALVL